MPRASLALVVGALCATIAVGVCSVALRAEESAKADKDAAKTAVAGWRPSGAER